MELAKQEKCTGCGACAAVCQKSAIRWKNDAAGFPVPEIDTGLCVDCGACERVCPTINPPQAETIRAAYAAQLKSDDATLSDSTSGGVFTALARVVLSQDGTVYGCVWTPDYRAKIIRATTEEDLVPMRGSKYVWSSVHEAYACVREDLDAGRTVLFSGLPCQIAGVKKVVKKADKLILLDHLCAGAPSPLAFDRYLDTLCQKEARPELNLKFRDKNPGGVGVHITYTGQKNVAAKKAEHLRNPYYYAFYTHLSVRDSCYTCPYCGGDRTADLTMGDFWGIEKVFPDMRIKDGVSALLVNTEKGASLLQAAADTLVLRPTELESIAAANNLFVGGKVRRTKIPEKRTLFFDSLRKYGWKTTEKRFLLNRARSMRILKALLPKKLVKLIERIAK